MLTSLDDSGWVYGALEEVVTSLIRSIVRTISLLVCGGRKENLTYLYGYETALYRGGLLGYLAQY